MERAAAVSEFNRLMRGNKKADLAQMVLNEERVANMWRDTAQMNDERIHQLEQDRQDLMRVQDEAMQEVMDKMEKLQAKQDYKEVFYTELVDNLKKENKRLQEAAQLSSKQAFEYMRYWEKAKEENKLITETLSEHRDSYIKVFDQLEKYHTGVLLHTDGTVNGTTFMIDGKTPHKMSSARIKANIKMGVQASYEVMETDKAERVWIFGEKSEVNLAYEKRRQTHKEYREDRVRAMILEAAAHNNRTAPKLPKKLQEINKWECSHCWAPNYTSETIFKKDRMKCGVCYQWTKADGVKA